MATTSAPPRSATEWEVVIGLEVHAQLLTRSKMFCSCPANYQQQPPNTTVCPVCMAMPGVLPVINQQAVAYTIMTGLALDCSIAEETHFDRKNYPYPDLMKGYQISQYDNPIAYGGSLELEVDGQRRRVGITRVHLEEDVAKLKHIRNGAGEAYSLLDVNRAGVPLMEVVGEPDLRTPEEARQYLIKLRAILQYLGVGSGDMEKGSFRCDANISLRPKGTQELSNKVEVKNMNSLRAVFRALEYEIWRQAQLWDQGGRVAQETRGWVEEQGVTVSQRSKEFAHDYRYFPEPDLPPLRISRAWVEELRSQLPELPNARRDRYMAYYRLSRYDASLLTASKPMADLFEACLTIRFPAHPELVEGRADEGFQKRAKAVANWLNGDMLRLLNQSGTEIEESQVTPEGLVELVELVEKGAISSTQAKTLFEELFATGASPRRMVEEQGLAQVSGSDELLPAVEATLDGNPQAVQDYLKGKETAIRFLMGQVMKATKGKANPTVVTGLLTDQLETRREK